MPLRNYRPLLNLLQSQVAWFACVLSAAAGRPWIGTSVALTLTAIHVFGSRYTSREFTLVLIAGLFGVIADSTLLHLGLLQFHSGTLVSGLSPHWMIALWINFATVLNYCLRWLKSRLWLASVLGAVAGPMAYYAGMRLGALQILQLPYSLGAIAVEWAIALTLLLWLARRWDTGVAFPKRALPALGAIILGLALISNPQTAAAAETKEWRFKVSLDGKPIGTQWFKLTTQDNEQQIQTQARFKVKIVGVTVYTYEHDNREVWRDGCLREIDAKTNDNGKPLAVRSSAQGEGDNDSGGGQVFKLIAPPSPTLTGCISTFAYWNPNFLRAQRLLNSQTGQHEAAQVTDRGTETLTVRGQQIKATRHTVNAGGYAIDVWYSGSGDWLALTSKTPQGRTLQYALE